MTNKIDSTLEKTARLFILLKWQDEGRLNGLGSGTIAKMFPERHRPTRMTIYRDMRDLPALREILESMQAQR